MNFEAFHRIHVYDCASTLRLNLHADLLPCTSFVPFARSKNYNQTSNAAMIARDLCTTKQDQKGGSESWATRLGVTTQARPVAPLLFAVRWRSGRKHARTRHKCLLCLQSYKAAAGKSKYNQGTTQQIANVRGVCDDKLSLFCLTNLATSLL